MKLMLLALPSLHFVSSLVYFAHHFACKVKKVMAGKVMCKVKKVMANKVMKMDKGPYKTPKL